jgi:hypothetical protein
LLRLRSIVWIPVLSAPEPTRCQPTTNSAISWIDILTPVVILAGIVLLAWFLFIRKRGGLPSAPQPAVPQSMVSIWSPLQ